MAKKEILESKRKIRGIFLETEIVVSAYGDNSHLIKNLKGKILKKTFSFKSSGNIKVRLRLRM